jgi:hypothetical protein
MARAPELAALATRYGLPLITIADLVQHRLSHDRVLQRVAEGFLRTDFGEFWYVTYRGPSQRETYIALGMGIPATQEDLPVSVHHECLAGHVFRAAACRCRAELERSLAGVAAARHGVVVYAREDTGPGASPDLLIHPRPLPEIRSLHTRSHRPAQPGGPLLDDLTVSRQVVADLRLVGPWAQQPIFADRQRAGAAR